MQRWLEQHWYSNKITLWGVLFAPLALLFALLVSLRRFFYKVGLFPSWRSPVPVIVVGNISVGGTGKTPLVIWLAEQLIAKGYSPGIISRGYGGSVQTPIPVSLNADPREVGDEPLLIAIRTDCPVWIGKKRPDVIRGLLLANPQCDVIISDDGLQHYAMQRDFEMVVIDGVRRYGNGLMLPLGPLREPILRVREVDAIVVNEGGADLGSNEYQMRLQGQKIYSLCEPKKVVVARHFAGKHIHAVAGIGHPQRFFNHLRELGFKIVEHVFPDHHQFQVKDLQIPDADAILMTEKDAVKCQQFFQDNLWVLPVQAEVSDGLEDKVIKKIEGFYGRKTA